MRAMFVLLLDAGCGHDRECRDPFFVDEDGDGHGALGESITRCSAPPGYASSNDDCDDSDATVHADADEMCNDRDDDCDGSVDDGAVDASLWYTDADADGFGDAGGAVGACTQPAGTVTDATDCDDAADAIHPGAQEICNALDDDCDDLTDDADPDVDGGAVFFLDADGDGFGVDTVTVEACATPGEYALESGDCDDATPTTFPGASESCDNGVDDDCDTRIDDCLPSLEAADVFFTGTSAPHGFLGYRIETGDLDGDGVADLIAGADYSAEAQAYVAFGPITADRTTDDADVAFRNEPPEFITPDSMASGDADDDGYDDILFSSHTNVHGYLFRGPVTADVGVSDADLKLVGADASMVVQILGDHDGDGSPDIAARAWRWIYSPDGHVYVASGNDVGTVDLRTDATYTYEYDHAANELGASIASVDDTTGDGIADLAVGDPYDWNHVVYIVAGGEPPGTYAIGSASVSALQSTGADGFGRTIAAADRDGDGYTDVVVGADDAVYSFLGPFADDRDTGDADVRWEGRDDLGYAIAADGDVDADGHPDVLFGSPDVYGVGAAYLQTGDAKGVVDVSDLVSFTSESLSLGYGVAFVPDWTGDGGSEVALGDIGFRPPTGGIAGRVAVFFSEAFY